MIDPRTRWLNWQKKTNTATSLINQVMQSFIGQTIYLITTWNAKVTVWSRWSAEQCYFNHTDSSTGISVYISHMGKDIIIRLLQSIKIIVEYVHNACILGSFIFSASWKMKNENLCSIFLFLNLQIKNKNRQLIFNFQSLNIEKWQMKIYIQFLFF